MIAVRDPSGATEVLRGSQRNSRRRSFDLCSAPRREDQGSRPGRHRESQPARIRSPVSESPREDLERATRPRPHRSARIAPARSPPRHSSQRRRRHHPPHTLRCARPRTDRHARRRHPLRLLRSRITRPRAQSGRAPPRHRRPQSRTNPRRSDLHRVPPRSRARAALRVIRCRGGRSSRPDARRSRIRTRANDATPL